jgi:hypothetical protein
MEYIYIYIYICDAFVAILQSIYFSDFGELKRDGYELRIMEMNIVVTMNGTNMLCGKGDLKENGISCYLGLHDYNVILKIFLY